MVGLGVVFLVFGGDGCCLGVCFWLLFCFLVGGVDYVCLFGVVGCVYDGLWVDDWLVFVLFFGFLIGEWIV